MIVARRAGETLRSVELDHEDELHFTLADGTTRVIRLIETTAAVTRTTLKQVGRGEKDGRTDYRFGVVLDIDNDRVQMLREVSTQRSFYERYEVAGLRIWPDAVDDIFNFLHETHGSCRPRKKVRLALQDATLRICPQLLHPWCPFPDGGPRIEDCRFGENCWLGAFNGAEAHGGLDINHPAGTPLWSPIDIHDHWLFDSLSAGDNNNRWRGVHEWPDGSKWILQSHHLIKLHVEERKPFAAGIRYADAAGVRCPRCAHTHFVFKVQEAGEDEVLLDPWILFWQMLRDREAARTAESAVRPA